MFSHKKRVSSSEETSSNASGKSGYGRSTGRKIKRFFATGLTLVSVLTSGFGEYVQNAQPVEISVENDSKQQPIVSEDEMTDIIKEVRNWLLISDGRFADVEERYLSDAAREALQLAHKFDKDSLDDRYIIAGIFVDYYSKIDPLERRYFDHFILETLTELHNHKRYKYAFELGLDYLTENVELMDPLVGLYVQKIMIRDAYEYVKSSDKEDEDSIIYALYYGYLELLYRVTVSEWHIDEQVIPESVEARFKITVPSDLFQQGH